MRDQLVSVQENATTLGMFYYDYQGMRVAKDMGGQIVHYTYDGKSVLTQSDVNGQTIAKYDYGPDQLLSMQHVAEGRQFYLFDALGSVSNLTNTSGMVQARYQYDAFGNLRAEAGSSFNRFTFTGHEKDTETGLYYFKSRFYDPDTGRFLNQDSYLGEINTPPSLHRYLYAYANPVVYVDLEGYEPIASRGSWCASGFEGECEGEAQTADVDERNQQTAPTKTSTLVESNSDRNKREIAENVEKIKRESNSTALVENEAGAGAESPCALGWGIVGCLTNKVTDKVGDTAKQLSIEMHMAGAGNHQANIAAQTGEDAEAAREAEREYAERVGDKVKEEAAKYSAAAIDAAGGAVVAGIGKAKKAGAAEKAVVPNKYYPKLYAAGANTRHASEVNRELAKLGYKSPYAKNAIVVEATLAKEVKLVRVFANANMKSKKSTPAGRWLMDADDIKGLSPKQIQEKYALPNLPTHIVDANIPSGTRVRAGMVGPNFGHSGGNVQYELLDYVEDAFSNIRPLK